MEYPARCFYAFMHENSEACKQNPIAAGDFKWILFVTVKARKSYVNIDFFGHASYNSSKDPAENIKWYPSFERNHTYRRESDEKKSSIF